MSQVLSGTLMVDSDGGNAPFYSGNTPLITLEDVDASIDKLSSLVDGTMFTRNC